MENEPEQQMDSAYQAPPPHYQAKQGAQRKKRLLLIGGIAAALLVIASAAFWFFGMRGKGTAPAPTPSTQQSQQSEDTLPSTPADGTPETYKSAKLNIELTHRKDWTLKEGTDGQIVLTSPRASAVSADGTAGTNVFTLKIRKGASDAMKAAIEKAIAVRDSEVIGYDAPTESQRFYTNVSYAGKDADSFGFFIVTGSTEVKAGKPFAYMLTFDAETFLIAGGYGADKTDSLAFDAVPKANLVSDVEEQALAIVKSLKIF